MNTRKSAEKIAKTLRESGYIAYFAGGWVRDFVMGHPSEDLDIATNASTDVIRNLFTKTVPVGLSFGVVIVIVDGHPFEVSTFRKDLGYLDGRRPESIEPAEPEVDALRRDFTINGMFYDPVSCSVIDYVGGREDIEKKVVKTIGVPKERFEEDRLRMIRAVRFACRFDFQIDPETWEGIASFSHVLYPAVAVERVWHEWKKMMKHANRSRACVLLYELGLLTEMFPPLKGISPEDLKRRCEPFDQFPSDTESALYLALLFSESEKETLLSLAEWLKLSSVEKKWIEALFDARRLGDDLVLWAKFLADPKSERILVCLRFDSSKIAQLKEKLAPHVKRIQDKTPLVTSFDLMQEGITPGIGMGKLLDLALKVSITENYNTKEEVLEILRKSPLWPK